jgi:hypothetical protein
MNLRTHSIRGVAKGKKRKSLKHANHKAGASRTKIKKKLRASRNQSKMVN